MIITGSNAKLLSGELATHLTGRYADFVLHPFSFEEFLRMKGIEIGRGDLYSTKKIAGIKRALQDYMRVGGSPRGQQIWKNYHQ